MDDKILVIDDDQGFLNLLHLSLEREGFTVITAVSGKQGLQQVYAVRPDIIVLDVMMPGMDGWATCRHLRRICDIPIIMLTAKTSEQDLLKGFSIGVDDYVRKPCSLDELKVRIKAVLRRAGSASDSQQLIYDDGNLRIDLDDGTIRRDGKLISLTPTESRVLMYLVRHKGRVVPHQELLSSVWGSQCAETQGYLSVYIRYLRQKIEEDPSQPYYIRTRWGLGYYFISDEAV
jgi:two-component system KDP operon response regulator KdpE